MLKDVFTFKIRLLFLLIFVSCQKEGCKDINSANFDNKATKNDDLCTYRYLSKVKLIEMKFIKNGAISWDSNDDVQQNDQDSDPDLRFYLKRVDSEEWELVTDMKTECCTTLPVTWTLDYGNQKHLETNTRYTYKLVDEDYSGEDLVLTGDFVPYWDYNSDTKSILLSNSYGTVKLELLYEVF